MVGKFPSSHGFLQLVFNGRPDTLSDLVDKELWFAFVALAFFSVVAPWLKSMGQ